ncbi:hypothetical protein L484_003701 [Morus notabilis]|uniref:Uncharacterized protein n=1 Tax=Morus notabilis TaxID=981085 RepID=W9QXN1_9ROSA|nr:hypothetical protein L484_003701 [Morus notabilis]
MAEINPNPSARNPPDFVSSETESTILSTAGVFTRYGEVAKKWLCWMTGNVPNAEAFAIAVVARRNEVINPLVFWFVRPRQLGLVLLQK